MTVIKHIAGPAARHHGRIAILVACGGPVSDFTLIIPARTAPGFVSRHFDNIPAGSGCGVRETADGHTNTVAVIASRSHTVTAPATGTVTVRLTDSFVLKPTPSRPPSPGQRLSNPRFEPANPEFRGTRHPAEREWRLTRLGLRRSSQQVVVSVAGGVDRA